MIKHHLPEGGMTACLLLCSRSDKQPSQVRGANREGGELKGEEGSSFAESRGQKVREGEEGGVNGEVLTRRAISPHSQKPLAVVSHGPAHRGVV